MMKKVISRVVVFELEISFVIIRSKRTFDGLKKYIENLFHSFTSALFKYDLSTRSRVIAVRVRGGLSISRALNYGIGLK